MPDLVAVGFLSMVVQVALLRELAVASFGVELAYLLGVGVWLVAGAAGATAGGLRIGADARGIGFAFLALGAIILPEIAFLRGARPLFGGVPGAYLPPARQLAVALTGLAPAGALLGWIFRRAAQRGVDEGRTPAAAYGWESAGGAVGSVIATGSLQLGMSNLLLAAGATLAAALYTARFRGSRGAALGLLALASWVFWNADALDRRMTGWTHPDIEASRDTPYGRVTVTHDRGLTAFFINDAFDYDTEGDDAEPFAHVPALQLPTGARMLVLGGGIAGLLPDLLKHAPSQLDFVESDRALHETLLRHLPPGSSRMFESKPVRVVFADPRRFLEDAARYDLILVATSEPASGGSNRFFTIEFFRLCASHLSPGGVMALRLPSSETVWTPGLLQRNGSVWSALDASFRDVLVLPGGTDLLLASRGRLVRDPAPLSERLRERRIAARVTSAEYLAWLLTNDRVARVGRMLAAAKVPPNSDSKPIGYQQTTMLWLGMLLPSGEISDGAIRILAWVTAGLAATGLLASRVLPGGRRLAIAALGGLGGMVAESVVLLRFQADSGALYGQLGLLLTSFMGGLAAGAFAFDRLADSTEKGARRRGGLLLASFAALEALIAGAGESGAPAFGLGFSAALLFSAGALSAALFAHASRMPAGGRKPALSGIYAADLLGGCLGSLLAGLVLIPLFGTGPVCLGTALLALAAIVALQNPGAPVVASAPGRPGG